MTFSRKHANVFALACCLFFVFIGSPWIWRPGIQTDEALFGSAIWNTSPLSFIRIFGHDAITMVMTYVGGLKGQIWKLIFAVFGVSAASIRIPALVLGAVSIWMFYRLCLRTLGVRVAVVGAALLATESTYLFTTRWDWGPVALQHLLFIGGLLALVRFAETNRVGFVGLAFFAFGLALWDKALFAWSLASLGVAGLAVFPREVWSRVTVRTVAVATVALLAGAFPLLRYNVRNHWVTFVSNTSRNTEGYEAKLRVLRETLNGTVAASPIVRDPIDVPPRRLTSFTERSVAAFSDALGSPRRNVSEWLLGIALLGVPFIWRTGERRAILFAMLWSTLTWLQMANVQGAGTSTHHTMLLWPMPVLAIAAGLAALSQRVRYGAAVLAVGVGVTAFWNTAVTATWYTMMLRNGGWSGWTDALYPLSDHLRQTKPEWACLIEWGFLDNLNVLHQGKQQLCVTDEPNTPEARIAALNQISNPSILFITHPPDQATEPARTQSFLRFAEEQGFMRTDLQTFSDSNGRRVIEVFRFAKKPAP